jgi:hypothetical protein
MLFFSPHIQWHIFIDSFKNRLGELFSMIPQLQNPGKACQGLVFSISWLDHFCLASPAALISTKKPGEMLTWLFCYLGVGQFYLEKAEISEHL